MFVPVPTARKLISRRQTMFAGVQALMTLLDAVDEGIYFTAKERRITFWN